MNNYTVLGYYEDSTQIFSHHVEARNKQHAFFVVAQKHETAVLVATLNGHVKEGEGIEFAGSQLVYAETVLEQPEVFDTKHIEQVEDLMVLADFEMQDWQVKDVGEGWVAPLSQKDIYRVKIEKSENSNKIYFNVYQKALDDLNRDVPVNGLFGRIEIRNGKPSIGLGIQQDNLSMQIESDIFQGLFVHTNTGVKPSAAIWSIDSGRELEGLYYKCGDGAWLIEARSDLANTTFQDFDYGERMVVEDNGWEIEDTEWEKVVFFENPHDDDSIKGLFKMTFAHDSTQILSINNINLKS